MSACPQPVELERWVREGPESHPGTAAHVAGCATCRQKTAQLRAIASDTSGLTKRRESKPPQWASNEAPTVRLLREPAPQSALGPTNGDGAASSGGDHAAGDLLGRFVILSAAGAGGMGYVYAAYDPELDRKVAIKLLRNDLPGEMAEDLRNRLLREAQAMARLSHPNVIPVYDVGTSDGQVFVAMEFVDGATLATHLAMKERTWREIIALYVLAGRGLQAAHEAGLVHRDFKPQNVLVSKDGQVRVLDFGLARPAMRGLDGPTRPSSPRLPSPSTPMLDTPLTRPGLLMGTPAYMAPEQFLDQAVDQRSDQFSFCVALYEALYGTRPFAGDQIDALMRAMEKGAVLPPPRSAKVPSRIFKLLSRGLSRDPNKRYASMAPLLLELSKDPHATRNRLLVGAGLALTVAATTGGAAWWSARARTVCVGAQERLVGAWDDERKEALRAAFVGTGAPFAADVFASAEKLIDAYAAAWVKQRTDACEATRLRGEQSERLLDLRIQCLDRKLGQVSALLNVFATADTRTVEHAVQAVESLGALNECADARQLGADNAPPSATVKGQVDQAYALLGKGKALADAMDVPKGLERVKEGLDVAAKSGVLSVVSEAQLTLADLDGRAGDAKGAEQALVSAALAADGAHRDDLRARSLTELGLVAFKAGRPEEALLEGQLANAALARAGGNDALQARLHHVLALVFHSLGRPEDAAAHFGKCVDLRKKAFGEDSWFAAASMEAFGKALHEDGKLDEAITQLRHAVELQEKTLGPKHPDVALARQALGSALFAKGELKEALGEQRAAVELLEAQPAPDAALIGAGHADVARTLTQSGDLTGAQSEETLALAKLQAALPPRHPSITEALVDLAGLQLQTHDAKGSLATARKATALVDGQSPVAVQAQATLAEVRAMWSVGAAHHKPALAKARGLNAQLQQKAPQDASVRALAAWVSSPH